MEELQGLKTWCELQIVIMENTIGKRGVISRLRRRWLMGEVCGIQKVLNRINSRIAKLEKEQ